MEQEARFSRKLQAAVKVVEMMREDIAALQRACMPLCPHSMKTYETLPDEEKLMLFLPGAKSAGESPVSKVTLGYMHDLPEQFNQLRTAFNQGPRATLASILEDWPVSEAAMDRLCESIDHYRTVAFAGMNYWLQSNFPRMQHTWHEDMRRWPGKKDLNTEYDRAFHALPMRHRVRLTDEESTALRTKLQESLERNDWLKRQITGRLNQLFDTYTAWNPRTLKVEYQLDMLEMEARRVATGVSALRR